MFIIRKINMVKAGGTTKAGKQVKQHDRSGINPAVY